MALPLVWLGMTVGGAAVSSTVSGLVSAPISAGFTATHYNDVTSSWYNFPVLPPQPSAIMQMYTRGILDENLTRTLLRNQGINWHSASTTPRMTNAELGWRGVEEMTRERPGVGLIMQLWVQGYWGADDDRAREAIKYAGGDAGYWGRFVTALYQQPDVAVMLSGWNRGTATEADVDRALIRHGFGHARHRATIKEQRFQVPGIATAVDWAGADLLDAGRASDLGLFNDQPPQLGDLKKWTGAGKELQLDITADGANRRATVGDMYWAAHWQQLSISQAVTAFHRLRPDRIAAYQALGFDVQPFTVADLRRSMRVNGVPSGYRDIIGATSYGLPRITYVKTALTLGHEARRNPQAAQIFGVGLQARLASFNRDWAVAAFQDYGLSPTDAGAQADITLAQAHLKDHNAAKKWDDRLVQETVTAVRKSYRAGVMDSADAVEALEQAGLSAGTAEGLIQLDDAATQLANSEALTKAIRQDFMLGGANADQAQGLLVSAGLTNDAASETVDRWQTQLSLRRRGLSTSQIQDYVARGWITVEQAVQRLTNLGWSNPDLALLMAQAHAKSLTLQAAALNAADRQNRQNVSELQKVANEAKRVYNQTQSAIRQATPVSTLTKWLRDGVITPPVYVQRLVAGGYPENIAQLYLQDVLKSKKSATVKKVPTPPPTPTESASAISQHEQQVAAAAGATLPPPPANIARNPAG